MEKSSLAINISDLVDEYTDALYSWAYHKTSDPEVAKDLTQDTFLAAVQGIERFKGNSTPRTWLFSILNNKIVDYYRKKVKNPTYDDTRLTEDLNGRTFTNDEHWTEKGVPSDWHDPDENLLDNPDFTEVFNLCIELLPEKWRLSVKFKYLTDKQGEEICQELGITPSNYWQILHRAKLQLRECIENKWFKY